MKGEEEEDMSQCFFSNMTHFIDLLIADLHSLFSLIHCHPLYIAYILFFFRNLLQFLSFLSPLLLSTFLLLLCLLTVSTQFARPISNISSSRHGLASITCSKALEILQKRLDGDVEFCLFGSLASMASEFGVFMWSEPLTNIEIENSVEFAPQVSPSVDDSSEIKSSKEGNFGFQIATNIAPHELNFRAEENPVDVAVSQGSISLGEYVSRNMNVASNPERFQLDAEKTSPLFEKLTHKVGENPVEVEDDQGNSPRLSENQEAMSWSPASYGWETASSVSEAAENPMEVFERDCKENEPRAVEKQAEIAFSSARFGSMRREKEWKRTLACKLYEERQTVDGSEGMDLLWEAYEVDSGKTKEKEKEKEKEKKEKNSKKSSYNLYKEEDDEADMDGQLCCLQALRFSTGKMNLGMGRPNLMRISKALKGMGMFVRKERKVS